jgi:hypothetical protein
MQNDKIPESMGDTVPQLIIDIGTGERHVIQLRPRAGLTAAEAQAFLDGRIAEGKRIDPENCDVTRFCVETVDSYGLFEVPGEWSCVGNETFVRNPPRWRVGGPRRPAGRSPPGRVGAHRPRNFARAA